MGIRWPLQPTHGGSNSQTQNTRITKLKGTRRSHELIEAIKLSFGFKNAADLSDFVRHLVNPRLFAPPSATEMSSLPGLQPKSVLTIDRGPGSLLQ